MPPLVPSHSNSVLPSPHPPPGHPSSLTTKWTRLSMRLKSLMPASPSSSPPPAQNCPSPVSPPPTSTPPPPPSPSQPSPPAPPLLLPALQVYELTPPPSPSIDTASQIPPEITEATKAKPQEQTDITSTGIGDANAATTKLEQAQVLRNDHSSPDDGIEGKPACNNGNVTSIIDHSSSDRSRAFNLRDVSNSVNDPGGNQLSVEDGSMCVNGDSSRGSSYAPRTPTSSRHPPQPPSSSSLPPSHLPSENANSRNGKIVHDPGGNALSFKDGSTRDDGTSYSTSSSSDNASCNAYAHPGRSSDRDRDKTVSTASDVDPVPLLDFAQVNRPVDAPPHSADNLTPIFPTNSRCADAQRPPSPQRAPYPSNSIDQLDKTGAPSILEAYIRFLGV